MHRHLLARLVERAVRVDHVIENLVGVLDLVGLVQVVLAEEHRRNAPAPLLRRGRGQQGHSVCQHTQRGWKDLGEHKKGGATSCFHTMKSHEKSSWTGISRTPVQQGQQKESTETQEERKRERKQTLQVGLVLLLVHLVQGHHLDGGARHGLSALVATARGKGGGVQKGGSAKTKNPAREARTRP